jgi:hypothetical protein
MNEGFLENTKILYPNHLFCGRSRRRRVGRGHNNRMTDRIDDFHIITILWKCYKSI